MNLNFDFVNGPLLASAIYIRLGLQMSGKNGFFVLCL